MGSGWKLAMRYDAAVHKYRTLLAWQRAHRLAVEVLRTTDTAYHPRSRALFDQVRRAAVSVEANVVEGYALGTWPYFRHHLRIAIGSAAEAECLVRLAGEVGYLPPSECASLEGLTGDCLRTLRGLARAKVSATR